MKTIRAILHGHGGSTTVTEYTSYSYNSSSSDAGRRYKSGWGTSHSGSQSKRPSGPPTKLEGKTYDEIKAQYLRENRLFEDPDFPAVDSSVFPSKLPPSHFEWKRPGVSNFTLCYATRLLLR